MEDSNDVEKIFRRKKYPTTRKESYIKLVEFLSQFDVTEEDIKKTKRMKFVYIRCLLHIEKTPSMRIVVKGMRYSCFGCWAEGKLENEELRSAILKIIEIKKSLESKRNDESYEDLPF